MEVCLSIPSLTMKKLYVCTYLLEIQCHWMTYEVALCHVPWETCVCLLNVVFVSGVLSISVHNLR